MKFLLNLVLLLIKMEPTRDWIWHRFLVLCTLFASRTLFAIAQSQFDFNLMPLP